MQALSATWVKIQKRALEKRRECLPHLSWRDSDVSTALDYFIGYEGSRAADNGVLWVGRLEFGRYKKEDLIR